MKKLNYYSIQGLVEFLKNSRTADKTSEAIPGQVLPTIKGFTFIPLEVLRTALMLPENFLDKEDGKVKKNTICRTVEFFHDVASVLSTSTTSLFSIELRKSLYRRDTAHIKLHCSPDELVERLGLGENEEDLQEYAKYLEKTCKKKAKLPGYDLFLTQKDTLVSELKKTTNLPLELLDSWVTCHTTFKDNRVFHPLVNTKKEQRRKVFNHELDIVSSQVSLLSKLVKDITGDQSEFTKLVDACQNNGEDIYIELAKLNGSEGITRSEAKTLVLKSLFDGSDSWIWNDEGVQALLRKVKNTEEYREYVSQEWLPFFDAHLHFYNAKACRIKFDKLFLRQMLTKLELTVMTMAAQVLAGHNETFITIHDAFSLKSAPSKESIKAIDKLSTDLGIRFSNTNYQD